MSTASTEYSSQYSRLHMQPSRRRINVNMRVPGVLQVVGKVSGLKSFILWADTTNYKYRFVKEVVYHLSSSLFRGRSPLKF